MDMVAVQQVVKDTPNAQAAIDQGRYKEALGMLRLATVDVPTNFDLTHKAVLGALGLVKGNKVINWLSTNQKHVYELMWPKNGGVNVSHQEATGIFTAVKGPAGLTDAEIASIAALGVQTVSPLRAYDLANGTNLAGKVGAGHLESLAEV